MNVKVVGQTLPNTDPARLSRIAAILRRYARADSLLTLTPNPIKMDVPQELVPQPRGEGKQ